MNTEIYKPIPGYEGCYEASNIGNIKSLKQSQPRIMCKQKNRLGYEMVPLSNRGSTKLCSVHRLVALAFIGPPTEESPIINHKDGNRSNNTVENLEYCNQSYNVRHGLALKPRAPRTPSSRFTTEEYCGIMELADQGKSYSEISKAMGISKDRVSSMFKHKLKRGEITRELINQAFDMAANGVGIAEITLSLRIPMDILRYLKLQ